MCLETLRMRDGSRCETGVTRCSSRERGDLLRLGSSQLDTLSLRAVRTAGLRSLRLTYRCELPGTHPAGVLSPAQLLAYVETAAELAA